MQLVLNSGKALKAHSWVHVDTMRPVDEEGIQSLLQRFQCTGKKKTQPHISSISLHQVYQRSISIEFKRGLDSWGNLHERNEKLGVGLV